MSGILSTLLGGGRPVRAQWADTDDRWYVPIGYGSRTASGPVVTPETALRLTAVYRCVAILAQTIAALPLQIYRRMPDGGKERATNNPLYGLLHDQPNPWQTSYDFRSLLMTHLCLRGNGYAEILPGPRGFADQLIPLHPDRVRVEMIEGYRLRYRYSDPLRAGAERVLTQDEVFHVRGPSTDGIMGMSPITANREAIGLALATEEYGARFFSNDATPGGVLVTPAKLDADAAKRMKESWLASQGGTNRHKVAVLEQGLKFEPLGMKNEDAQFLDTRRFQVEEIARMFGIPPHMIGATDKSTTWGSGLEQQTLGFIIFTLTPWLEAWEQAISRDLILIEQIYFAQHTIEGLLRGDSAARAAFYQSGIQNGWLSPNEVRVLEDRNARDGGDSFVQPTSKAGAAKPTDASNGANQQTQPVSVTVAFGNTADAPQQRKEAALADLKGSGEREWTSSRGKEAV